MDWQPLLAYIAGSVDEELMLRDEYLVTEIRQQPDDPICCRERLGGTADLRLLRGGKNDVRLTSSDA